MNKKALIVLCALCAPALLAAAQDGPPPGSDNGPRRAVRVDTAVPAVPEDIVPCPSPLMMALDANHDGVIDATEISNAPAALKTLDKNGDGKLTQDELRPQRPDHEQKAAVRSKLITITTTPAARKRCPDFLWSCAPKKGFLIFATIKLDLLRLSTIFVGFVGVSETGLI